VTCSIMRNFLYVFALVVFECTGASAAANIIDANIVGNYDMKKHTIITGNGSFSGGIINVIGSVLIENGGEIHSNLNICNNCDVSIQNFGVYDASVTLGSDATITQIMTNSADVTRLNNIGVNYDVCIRNTPDVLNWNDIVNNTSGSGGQYTLSDAKIHMDNIIAINDVALDGIVYVYTDTMPDTDTMVFNNPSGDGTVRVVYNGDDPLHFLEAYKSGGNVFVRVTRSTDYARILDNTSNTSNSNNNQQGNILNELRQESPNDKLIEQLDSAQSINEINHIISQSVKFHPIKLMRSIKTIYSHKTLEIMHIDQYDGFGVMPFGFFSNDMSVFGVEPNLHINISDNFKMKLFGNISNLKYSDDINEYSAAVYGFGTDVVYLLPYNNFIRALAGAAFSSFNTGKVFNGNKTTKNPSGFLGYGVTEFGHKFTIGDNNYVSPFVMMGGDYATVLNSKDADLYAGSGVNVGTVFEIDGLTYSYGLRGVLRTDGSVGGNINMSVWSAMDDAGADFTFGTMYDKTNGLSYHISLNAKFDF